MTYINNFIHSDYVFFPLWIGVGGCITWAWWSESTRVFTSIAKTQFNVDCSTPTSDTVRGYITSNTSTITPNFQQRLQNSIQADLERVHSSYHQNVNSIKVTEKSFNATELYDSDRLDLLSNTLWASSNTPMELALQNGGNVLTSYPQVVDLISL
jgi:hypothetical protein